MGNAVKIGDKGTSHHQFPMTLIREGSSTVYVDNLPAARQGDSLESHSSPNAPMHKRSISSGSSTVYFDNKPAARTGDSIDCGGFVIGGGTVTIG